MFHLLFTTYFVRFDDKGTKMAPPGGAGDYIDEHRILHTDIHCFNMDIASSYNVGDDVAASFFRSALPAHPCRNG
jgi:hypothetical protein